MRMDPDSYADDHRLTALPQEYHRHRSLSHVELVLTSDGRPTLDSYLCNRDLILTSCGSRVTVSVIVVINL